MSYFIERDKEQKVITESLDQADYELLIALVDRRIESYKAMQDRPAYVIEAYQYLRRKLESESA